MPDEDRDEDWILFAGTVTNVDPVGGGGGRGGGGGPGGCGTL